MDDVPADDLHDERLGGKQQAALRYGKPVADINIRSLQLDERLLPYLYTLAANAHGLGSTRPPRLNYPDDPNTWGGAVKYEFLAGVDFLVAPVYEDADARDGIHLPEGRCVDYWTGGSTRNSR